MENNKVWRIIVYFYDESNPENANGLWVTESDLERIIKEVENDEEVKTVEIVYSRGQGEHNDPMQILAENIRANYAE